MSITIKRPTRVVDLCTDMSLVADHERASRALEDAQKRGQGLENTGVPEAARRVTDLEEQMRASTLEFTLQAVPRKTFEEFTAEHPAREDDQVDQTFGLNVSELDGLIAQCIVGVRDKGGAEVEFDPAVEWAGLAGQMTDGQWQEFALTAINIQRGGGTTVPFSRAASLAMAKYGPTSN